MRKTGRLKRTPSVPPVRRIVLPEKFSKWKILLIAVLFAGGITLAVMAAVNMVRIQPGWQTIQVDSGLENTVAYDFTLQYLLGQTDQKTNKENSAVTEIYTQAAADAYRIFCAEDLDGEKNIYYINRNPGQQIEVDGALYEAFSLLAQSGSRALYLAPVYENNRVLLASDDDLEAAQYDPAKNPDVQTYYEEVLAFAADPEMVELELLGNNQVRLNVSQEYAAYAAENGIEDFIDLDWMRNAFVIDYLADVLIQAGYTNGVLLSYDGFTRNLDQTGRTYTTNLHDGTVYAGNRVASMEYTGVQSMVWLRDYPISETEVLDFYCWQDGRISHAHLDPADGLAKAAVRDFVGYSRSLGCAELLLQIAPVYTADQMDWDALAALPQAEAEYAVVSEGTLYASDRNVTFTNCDYEVRYDVPVMPVEESQ